MEYWWSVGLGFVSSWASAPAEAAVAGLPFPPSAVQKAADLLLDSSLPSSAQYHSKIKSLIGYLLMVRVGVGEASTENVDADVLEAVGDTLSQSLGGLLLHGVGLQAVPNKHAHQLARALTDWGRKRS